MIVVDRLSKLSKQVSEVSKEAEELMTENVTQESAV